jgi:hypothetical protein
VAVALEDPHNARRHALCHVAGLRDGWNEMIVLRRQK